MATQIPLSRTTRFGPGWLSFFVRRFECLCFWGNSIAVSLGWRVLRARRDARQEIGHHLAGGNRSGLFSVVGRV